MTDLQRVLDDAQRSGFRLGPKSTARLLQALVDLETRLNDIDRQLSRVAVQALPSVDDY